MKTSRRQFIQATAATMAAAAAARAQDPFAPADAGLPARWFDKGRQHVLPGWAFSSDEDRKLRIPPTPAPVSQKTFEELRDFPDAFKDGTGVGGVFHGIAAEWNGDLIGGNDDNKSAWESMRDRVTPDKESEFRAGSLDGKGNWGAYENRVRCYRITMRQILRRLRPDVPPAVLSSYHGMVPGPTLRFRHGIPAVVRFENQLDTETSIHLHGAHTPSHADGFPSFYVLQGEARDYFYPNILPLRQNGPGEKDAELDYGEGQSTMWYHDHGLDVTAYNVSHGLAGFALWFDDLELKLIREGVLPGIGVIRDHQGRVTNESISGFDPDIPEEAVLLENAWSGWKAKSPGSHWSGRHQNDPAAPVEGFYNEVRTPYFNPYDIPMVLQDRIINQETGQIVYDSNGHNGYIGGTQLVNGVAWPVLRVKRRKYRFRILDGSNARIFRLRFLDGSTFRLQANAAGELEPANISDAALEAGSMEFLRIGKDSWLWPMPQQRKSIILNMANRADLILDFKVWHAKADSGGQLNGNREAEFFMVNTMPQFDGRGPKGKLAEDAGDPQVFPLPFDLDPNNVIVAGMRAAGAVPDAFFGGGPQGRIRELNQPVGLLKIIIEDDEGEGGDASIDVDTILRPRHAIPDEDVMAVREFVFERGRGAWMTNGRFYDPTISNASPVSGIKGLNFRVPDGGKPEAERVEKKSLEYAEEWILRNGGGGWWHPIHIHMEGHQLVGYEKDFEADGLIDGDGILGARAQANMAGLPHWADIAGRYGLEPLKTDASPGQQAVIQSIIDMITMPELAHFAGLLNVRPELIKIMLPTPSTRNHSGAAALLGLLRKAPAFEALMNLLNTGLRTRVAAILEALEPLRLQWTGEMVGNHDTQALGPNTIARIRMRFRTFSGPVVLHCHNVEHEDMRMMVNFEPAVSLDEHGKKTLPNTHDPDTAPAARSHGQSVTDLKTNPGAVGEMPWETMEGFPAHWEQPPVPYTAVDRAGEPLIKPRSGKN